MDSGSCSLGGVATPGGSLGRGAGKEGVRRVTRSSRVDGEVAMQAGRGGRGEKMVMVGRGKRSSKSSQARRIVSKVRGERERERERERDVKQGGKVGLQKF